MTDPTLDPCPNEAQHTPQPRRYGAWHAWAEQMARTHQQRMCPGCQRWEIWEPTPGAPDLPSIGYRLDHLSCKCCEGDPACTCQYHQPVKEPACPTRTS